MSQKPDSWGSLFDFEHEIHHLDWSHEGLPEVRRKKGMLPFGMGRSYGDSCLNENGILLLTRGLRRWISFDHESGIFRCEAGVSLDEVLKITVPEGWFLPVVPGTKFITIGGAIANDVHGKNHHCGGTFGCHVTRFELLRSDGSRMECSTEKNPELFAASIGGMGLTGLIIWAEIKLRRIPSSSIEMESIKVRNLDEFIACSEGSDKNFEYTVSWLDCLASGPNLGRGLFMRGNHAKEGDGSLRPHRDPAVSVPFNAPGFILNRFSIHAFNFLYFNKQLKDKIEQIVHYDPFFFPLDAIDSWNRIYGRRGFFQYQFVIPHTAGHDAVRDILKSIAKSGQGSFLGVIKAFGDIKSPGLMSFPCPGITVALDFPNRGRSTLELFEELDQIVKSNEGREYAAKDARMSPASFRKFYPQWDRFSASIDPAFSSSFWRRVTEN